MKALRKRLKTMNPMWWFLPPFLVVVAMNIYFVSTAIKTFDGVTDKQAYEKGLAYNQTLAERATMAGLGWQTTWQLADYGDRSADVVVTAADAKHLPLTDTRVELHISRPVGQMHDVVVPMLAQDAGRFSAHLNLPWPGQWNAEIIVTRGGDVYRAEQRFALK